MNATPQTSNDEVTARSVGYITLILGFAILTTSILSSCNTTRGFGRDVKKVGSQIEKGANHVERRM